MKWDNVLGKFREFFSGEVRRSTLSPLKREQNITLMLYTEWMKKKFAPPKKRGRRTRKSATKEAKLDLAEVLRLHALWRADDPLGKRADLSGADLSYADLRGADLTWANLSLANLVEADLSGAKNIHALSDSQKSQAIL